MDTTINRRAGDIVVTFYVDGIAKMIFIGAAGAAKIDTFGNIGGIGIHFLVGLEQLPAINGFFAAIGNIPIRQVTDTFIPHIDTAVIDNRATVIDGQTVRGEIRIGGNGNFLAGMGNGNVRAVFEIHGIARRDIGRAAAIGLHIPAFVGGSFYRLDGIMHGIFAGIANIAHGDIAAVIHRRIAAQDVFAAFANIADGVLRPIELAAVDGVGAGSANFAGGDVLDLPFGICFANRDLVACRNVCAACKTAVGDAAHCGLGYAGGGGIGIAVCAEGNSVGLVGGGGIAQRDAAAAFGGAVFADGGVAAGGQFAARTEFVGVGADGDVVLHRCAASADVLSGMGAKGKVLVADNVFARITAKGAVAAAGNVCA